MSSGEDKTEKPTAKRRREARKDGQVPRTPDLGGWLSVLVLGLAIGPLLDHEVGAWRELIVASLRSAERPSVPLALHLLGNGARHAFFSILVVSGIVMVVGVVSAVGQGGLVVSPKLVKPSFKKLDPIQGFKKVFGPKALWEGAKMLLKSAVVAVLGLLAVKSVIPLVGGLVPIDTTIAVVHDKALGLVRNVALAALVMAAADYAVQRRRVEKKMRMGKSEVKQEHKQSEGDPLVKSAIRARQLAAARNRMMADVATADVVLTNPTHIAIALRYNGEAAPRVVARGAGAIAAKIRSAAEEASVPQVQDVPLARALYRSCEVGQQIPSELWTAVAQVLAFVISRRRSGLQGGQHRSPRPDRPLPDVLPARQRRRPARSGS
ncbi:flagellar biosynthetic protein FlhB [Nocardioides terrae]|uniref:Flagellar biosynthetic protein FlhB n=1 Tax=Nocardioides terrae TaxID=574651 RepID=A0A1I1IHM8_9ACTN|nr:EscU/YscU/HrcU family type III secretion system export apparatus switch protein [Nocardioides terrae]SFC33273.1 flagellar biosynthetic protein FlhB [Nocardioides terrae]